jgi:hypothetical protein
LAIKAASIYQGRSNAHLAGSTKALTMLLEQGVDVNAWDVIDEVGGSSNLLDARVIAEFQKRMIRAAVFLSKLKSVAVRA